MWFDKDIIDYPSMITMEDLNDYFQIKGLNVSYDNPNFEKTIKLKQQLIDILKKQPTIEVQFINSPKIEAFLEKSFSEDVLKHMPESYWKKVRIL